MENRRLCMITIRFNFITFRFHYYSWNRTFAAVVQRRNYSNSENQTTESSEAQTELEKKLQAEVDSLTGQVAKLSEKSDELLVSGVMCHDLCPHKITSYLHQLIPLSIDCRRTNTSDR